MRGGAGVGQEYKSEKYLAMWYKNGNSFGIRRKFGDGKQCFSFGGKRCGLSREVLDGFAGMALKKLDDGLSEKDAATWAKDAVRRDDD